MWLIDTSTLKLRFFADPGSQRYAILSHTWGDEEVTFQEMNAPEGPDRAKKGWKKIAETCRLACNEHRLKYAWVDTCCIDKSSSAELSEAINSMFNWYKWSHTCFVFLEDVEFPLPGPHGNEALRRGTPEFQNVLRSARWFSRGWTLQELVASGYVVFYDASGTQLGDKFSLADDLVQITNIDRAVLKDVRTLPMVPVARKMSWAARRETTRVEDMAYCLLGMFDVNMPLLYGEGSRAFLRLQEEIARSGSDLSLLAWMAPYSPSLRSVPEAQVCGIFAPSPAEFWNGHNLRLPGWALEQNFDLSLADRGFLRISRNIYVYREDCARLVLDCLVTDNQAPSGTTWLEVDLRKIGSFYARTDLGPSALVKTTERHREYRDSGGAWPREPVSVATALPQALVEAYGIRPQPSRLFYTKSLQRHVGAAQGIQYSNPLNFTPRTLRSAPVLLTAPKGKRNDFFAAGESLKGFAKRFDNTFLPVKGGVFSTKGIRGSRHHHLFEFNSVPVALVWCQETTMTEGHTSPPWAILLCPETCLAAPGGSDIFRSLSFEGRMTEEERSKILHDFVFQWYSDDTGGYRTENIPTSLRLVGQVSGVRVVHEIEVHAALGFLAFLNVESRSELESFVSLVLSHRLLPDDSEPKDN